MERWAGKPRNDVNCFESVGEVYGMPEILLLCKAKVSNVY